MTADEALSVRELESGDEGRWDAFVDSHAVATFFHLSGWKRAVEEGLRRRCRYMMAERDGAIVGILPLVHVNSRLFGNSLISTGFSVYGGPVTVGTEVDDALDAAAEQIARETGAEYIEYRNQRRQRPGWPAKEDKYATFKRPILEDSEANLLAIPRKQRAVVRKALKSDLRAEFSDDLDSFYALFSRSYRDHGTPVFPKRFFEVLMAALPERIRIMQVADGGEPLSAVMTFYQRDQVMPYFAGARSEARRHGANDLVYWSLIEDGRERGFKVFDFGRSKTGSGSYSFKKNWGFEPQPLCYEYKLCKGGELPDVSPNNPKFKAFIALWRRLPLPLANRLGPWIVRSLG